MLAVMAGAPDDVLPVSCQPVRACLQETEARKVLQQLLDALEYCHKQGVFHR